MLTEARRPGGAKGGEQASRLGRRLGGLGGWVGVADQRGPEADAQPACRVDVGGPDQDGGVHGALTVGVPADQRGDAAVVATAARLVPVDDPAGAL